MWDNMGLSEDWVATQCIPTCCSSSCRDFQAGAPNVLTLPICGRTMTFGKGLGSEVLGAAIHVKGHVRLPGSVRNEEGVAGTITGLFLEIPSG